MIINGFGGGGFSSNNDFTNIVRTQYTLTGSYAESCSRPSNTTFDTVWSNISSNYTKLGTISYTANANITLNVNYPDGWGSNTNCAGAVLGTINYTVPNEYKYVPFMLLVYATTPSSSTSFTNGQTGTYTKVSGDAYGMFTTLYQAYSEIDRGVQSNTEIPSVGVGGVASYQERLTYGYSGGKYFHSIGDSSLGGATNYTSDTSRTNTTHFWCGNVQPSFSYQVRIICTGGTSSSATKAYNSVVYMNAAMSISLYILYEPLWPNIWNI